MLEGISTSDWHFNGLKNLFPNNHIDLQLHEIEKVFKYAVENGIKHVFVPGDISDTPDMGIDAYTKLIILLKKYCPYFTVYYLAGNHDFSDISKTSLDFLRVLILEGFFDDKVKLYAEPTQFKLDGVMVNMLPHPAESSIPHDKPCLNFAHVEYNGAIGDNGRKLKTKHELQVDPRDWTVSGHIHKYQNLKSKRATYNGNPFQKNFGECLEKGFIHFKAKYKNGKLIFKHEFIDNTPEFRLETHIIEAQADFSKLKKSETTLYRLYVDPSVTIPDNLRIEYPNIRQLKDSQGKKLSELESADSFKQELISIPKISPIKGLKVQMKADGFKSKDFKRAKAILEQEASNLGVAI